MNPYRNKSWLLSFLILMLLYGKSSAQGIDFVPAGTSWTKALQIAKDSGRLLFVDVYTDWCGPCKKMDAEVFPMEAVGKKINTSFINYKLDAEKGPGPTLKKHYHVSTYPTYLFVRGDGVLIYRANGSMDAASFIREANNAIKEARNPVTLVQLDSIYLAGNRDKQFMYTYLKKRLQLKQESAVLLDQYVSMLTPEEQQDTLNLKLIADNGNFLVRNLKLGKAMDVLLLHGEKIGLTEKDMSGLLGTAITKTLSIAIQQKDKALLQQALKANEKNADDFNDNNKALVTKYYFQTNQVAQYRKAAVTYAGWLMNFSDGRLDSLDKQTYDEIVPHLNLSDLPEAERESYILSYKRTQSIMVVRALEEICRQELTTNPDKQTLINTSRWGKRMIQLVEKDTAYYKYIYPPVLKTYAEVLYKNNRVKEATLYMEKAVQLMGNEKVKQEYAVVLLQMRRKNYFIVNQSLQ